MTEPTIRDVARRAQVSIASVSRALNGLGNVAEQTRLKVEVAVRELGYVPHAGARSLLTGLFGGGETPAAPVRSRDAEPDWPRILATAQSGLPGAHLTRTAPPVASEGVVSFRARMPGEWHPNGRSTVHADLAGREVLLAHDATAQAAGARMTEAIYPLHIGAVGGLLMRLLTALAGLVPAFLLTTGFLFWLRRPARK